MVATAQQSKLSSGVCNRFRPQRAHSRPSWQMDQWWPGAFHSLVVTAQESKLSSGVCSRFRPQKGHLLQSWKMGQWLPGAIQNLVVTAQQSRLSSKVPSRFRPRSVHSLRSWQMDQFFPGVSLLGFSVMTSQQSRQSSWARGRFRPHRTHSLPFWQMDQWFPGAFQQESKLSLEGWSRFRPRRGPLLPPPAPRRARRPPGPVLTKVQGAKGRKTYRAFSGLLHQDVLGALGLCADNGTGCELEKHVRRLVGSLPWGFALSILQTKWSCVSKIDSSTSLQGSCLAHCCSVSLLSWSPKLASSRLAFRLSNTGFAKSIHIYNAVLCGLAP